MWNFLHHPEMMYIISCINYDCNDPDHYKYHKKLFNHLKRPFDFTRSPSKLFMILLLHQRGYTTTCRCWNAKLVIVGTDVGLRGIQRMQWPEKDSKNFMKNHTHYYKSSSSPKFSRSTEAPVNKSFPNKANGLRWMESSLTRMPLV